jgi:hypothetical protein
MIVLFDEGFTPTPNPYFNTDNNILSSYSNLSPPISYLISWILFKDISPLFFDGDLKTISLTKNYYYAWNFLRYSSLGIIVTTVFVFMMSLLLLFQLSNMKTGSPIIKFLTIFALSTSCIFIFTFTNANPLMLTAAFMAFFVANYNSDNKTMRELSYVSLALAASIKITPAFMGILLLFNKQWSASIKVAIYSVLLIFVPFFFIDSSLGISGSEGGIISNFIAGVSQWIKILSSYGDGAMSFPVWIGGFDKTFTIIMNKWIYVGCIISSLLAIATAPFLKKEDEWKKVFLMMLAMLLIHKGAKFQHYLLFLFPCIIMFLNANLKVNFKNTLYLISILLILNPVQVGKFRGIVTVSVYLIKFGFLSLFAHLLYDSISNFIRSRTLSKEGTRQIPAAKHM